MIETTYTIDGREICRAKHQSLREAIASLRRLRQAALESYPGDGLRRTVALSIELCDSRLGCDMVMGQGGLRTDGDAIHDCVSCGARLH